VAFQTPITVKEVLTSIQRHDYILPAIQREFTWDTEQICGLFDSLMQGYPVGSFLFWKVEPGRTKDYSWYGFMKDFHRKKNRHCQVLDVPEKPVVAILDGQQRLTSLNIGLRGSHAEKEPRKWWDNPSAFPVKYLYLNLMEMALENEQGLKYDFRFLTPERAESDRSESTYWFRVSDVFDFDEDFDVIKALQKMTLGNDQHAARQAIHALVDELNGIRGGFNFSKDLILKAGLMLSDIPSVAFRVTNFNAANMKTLVENWPNIDRALRLGVELLGRFGLSRQTLAADSVHADKRTFALLALLFPHVDVHNVFLPPIQVHASPAA